MTVAGRSLKGVSHQGWSDTADMIVVVTENVACHCFSRCRDYEAVMDGETWNSRAHEQYHC